MKTKTDPILIASFPSIAAAEKGINGYFFSSTISLTQAETGSTRYILADSTGFARPNHYVERKRNRFRFYCLPKNS